MLVGKPHHRALALCLARVPEAVACFSQQDWDWQVAVKVASEELILPSIQNAIVDLHIEARVPTEVANVFQAVYQLNHERNREIWEELEVVVRFLNTVGIEPILLKGVAYLAERIYADPGERYLADIDLLLRPEQIDEASNILRKNGFQIDAKDRLGMARHHHPPLVRPGKVGVELHHSLGIGVANRLLPADEVVSRSQPCVLGGGQVRIPSPEHLLTHLIVHSQLHHPYVERIWPPLRAILDLHRIRHFYGQTLDWNNVASRFRSQNREAVYQAHLVYAGTLMSWEGMELQSLSPVLRLRLMRRGLLWRFSWLRLVDPLYLLRTLITPRLELARLALQTPDAWKYILATPFRLNFYRRLWTDLLHR